jgi:hypothetical protein
LALEVDLGFAPLLDESVDAGFLAALSELCVCELDFVLEALLLLVAERLSEKMSGLWDCEELERWALDEEELDEEFPILSATCHQSV